MTQRSHILRRAEKSLLLLLCSMLLIGCTAKPKRPIPAESEPDIGTESSAEAPETGTAEQTGPAEQTAPADSEPAETPPAVTAGCMPVISIQTKNTGSDALKFVTEPVAEHVSASIASWTPGYRIPPAPYYEACTVTLTGTDQAILLDAADAEVKVRGNWTTSYDKKPLRIKFSEKHSMLGLNSGAEMKNWVLLAEYKDVSMLRNKTALEIARGLLEPDGLYAADAQLCEVYINQQYWGVYLLTEQQQTGKKRVAVSDPKKDETTPMTGYFLEFDGYFSNEDALHQFEVDYNNNAPLVPYDGNGGSGRTMTCLPESRYDRKVPVGFTIKSDIRSQAQHDFIASYINNVYRILYAAAYQDEAWVFDSEYSGIQKTSGMTPRQAVEQVVDVQSLADIYILNEIACDADLYWSSFFMDVDFTPGKEKKLTFEAPWDFDSALGIKNRCPDGTGWYAANIIPDVNEHTYETINPWLAVLIYEDWFQQLVREKWTAAYDAGVFTKAQKEILTVTDACKDAFSRNYSAWGSSTEVESIAQELSPAAMRCKTQPDAAGQFSGWLKNRIDFLNSQWHT